MHEESSHWIISDLTALVEVNFEDIRAVLGKGNNGFIFELLAVIKFELGNRQHSSKRDGRDRRLARLMYLQF